MEVEEEKLPCKIVYFCINAGEPVNLLYDAHSPPDAAKALTPAEESEDKEKRGLRLILENARALLDPDRGGFQEGKLKLLA